MSELASSYSRHSTRRECVPARSSGSPESSGRHQPAASLISSLLSTCCPPMESLPSLWVFMALLRPVFTPVHAQALAPFRPLIPSFAAHHISCRPEVRRKLCLSLVRHRRCMRKLLHQNRYAV